MSSITKEDYLKDFKNLKTLLKKYSKPRHILAYSLTLLGFLMLNSYFELLLLKQGLVCG